MTVYIYVTDSWSNYRLVKRDASDLSYVSEIGSGGTGDDEFLLPYGVAVDNTHVFIADEANNRIKKHLASDLSYVSKIGSHGSGNDQFDDPTGIAVDNEHVYVADTTNHRIVKRLKSDLSYVSKIGSEGSGNNQFNTPRGIECYGEYLYVADTFNNRIVKRLKSNLSYVTEVDCGENVYPTDIYCGGDYIYIVDYGNDRIVKRNANDLSYVDEIGTRGSGNDEFYEPTGIDGDETHLYISDFGNHRIKKHLKSDLSYVSKIGSLGSGDDNFNYPWGMAIDPLSGFLGSILPVPTIEFKVNGTEVDTENIMECNIHLGCTKEVSTFVCVIDNSNPDYNDNDYSPGEAKEFTKGHSVTIKIKRGTISEDTNYLFTGTVETLEYIDEAEEYQYRNVVILSGRCDGQQLFNRKYDGDLIEDVGSSYQAYKRAEGEAESLVAYLIDNYTSLSHIRTTDLTTDQSASGQKVVNVTDGTLFTAGDLVKIYDDNAWEYNKVASISTNALTMTSNLVATYETADNATVGLDLIRDTNYRLTKMKYSHETVFDIIKWLADTTSTSDLWEPTIAEGTIGYDSRVEYDGKYAFLPRGLVTESYSLSAQVQTERYLDDSTRIKNKITVYGKAEKPYPIDADGQDYSDSLTETYTQLVSEVASNVASGQKNIVLDTGEGSNYSVDDYIHIIDNAGIGEMGQVDSVSTDTLSLKSNLVNSYTTAGFAVVFLISTADEKGWGYRPTVAWDDLVVNLYSGQKTEGTYSIAVSCNNNLTTVPIFFNLEEGAEINGNEYLEIRGALRFATTVPSLIEVYLYSGTEGSYTSALCSMSLSPNANQWTPFSLGIGEKNEDSWILYGAFDWTDIKIVRFDVTFPSSSTYTFYIDRFHFFGKRWGGGSDNSAVDGFAEDTSSQSTYGIREHVVVNDLLLSDAECEVKAQSLLTYYTNPRVTIIPNSKTVDWEDYPIIPGNKVAVNLTPLGISGNYRIDAVDIRLNAVDHELDTIFEMDDTPPRTADYLQGIVDRIKDVEKSVQSLSSSTIIGTVKTFGSGGSISTQAIAAVEGEATLDLDGSVTIAVGQTLSVDTINEKGSGTGVTIDTLLIKDGKLLGTVTIPSVTDTLMTLGQTQTVSGAITFSHASTPILTDIIAERTGATGVTIDSLTLKDGNVELGTGIVSRTITGETLGVGATTFAVTGEAMEITGDGGGNTVATITGGATGQILILTFVDANVTVTDTDAHTVNTVDLVGVATDFTSADDSTLTLFFDGTSYYELSRSVN